MAVRRIKDAVVLWWAPGGHLHSSPTWCSWDKGHTLWGAWCFVPCGNLSGCSSLKASVLLHLILLPLQSLIHSLCRQSSRGECLKTMAKGWVGCSALQKCKSCKLTSEKQSHSRLHAILWRLRKGHDWHSCAWFCQLARAKWYGSWFSRALSYKNHPSL